VFILLKLFGLLPVWLAGRVCSLRPTFGGSAAEGFLDVGSGQRVRNLLKTKGRICDSWRGLLLMRAGATRVTGREDAVASCGERSLAANMGYYNTRVNVTLWLEMP